MTAKTSEKHRARSDELEAQAQALEEKAQSEFEDRIKREMVGKDTGDPAAKREAAKRKRQEAASALDEELKAGARKAERGLGETIQNLRAATVGDLEKLDELTDELAEAYQRVLQFTGEERSLQAQRGAVCSLAGIQPSEIEASIPDSALSRLADLKAGKVWQAVESRITAARAAAHQANQEAEAFARHIQPALLDPERPPFDLQRWDATVSAYRSLPDEVLDVVGPELRSRMATLREQIVAAIQRRQAPGAFDQTQVMCPVPE